MYSLLTQYYIEFNIVFNYRFYNIAKALLYLSNVLNIMMLVLNILRKIFLYKLTAYRATTNIKEQMYKMFLLEMPLESLVIIINPSPYFLNTKRLPNAGPENLIHRNQKLLKRCTSRRAGRHGMTVNISVNCPARRLTRLTP